MTKKSLTIIGVMTDLGSGWRGTDSGPSALRAAGLNVRLSNLGYELIDAGNINAPNVETLTIIDPGCRYMHEIVRSSQQLADLVETTMDKGSIPVVLGGDHSVAIGTVSGLAVYHRKRSQRMGLLWLDAHADMNTPETSPSGGVHGMPFAIILGYGPRELTHLSGFAPKVLPEDCVLVGLRSVDPGETEIVKASGVRVITMREIDERGMNAVMDEAIAIASRNTVGFHVTMDMDFVDPDYAPGVSAPERGGPNYRESHLALEKVFDSGRMLSFEVTELNPLYDIANRTAELGVGLTLSAFGKKII